MATASSKPKPETRPAMTAKSPKAEEIAKKFTVYIKSNTNITATDISEYICDIGYDYISDIGSTWVVIDEPVTVEEFDKAWEKA